MELDYKIVAFRNVSCYKIVVMAIYSGKHFRAAREYLGWSQAQLAKRSGVAQPTISGLESGKTGDVSASSLKKLEDALASGGVIIKQDRLEFRNLSNYEIDGEGWWLRLLDDVAGELATGGELIILCSDDRESNSDTIERIRAIRAAGVSCRNFVREGNTYLLGAPSEYRWLPKERFLNTVTLVYGDRIAVCADDNTKAVVIHDPSLVASWRNVLALLWDQLEQPKESTAHERF